MICACIDDLNTISCVLSIVSCVLSIGGIGVSVVALIYSVRVNKRVLKVEGVRSMELLDPVLEAFDSFCSFLADDNSDLSKFTMGAGLHWGYKWSRIIRTIEDLYEKEDISLLKETMNTMFEMRSHLLNIRQGHENIYKNTTRQQCYTQFSELFEKCINISPKYK